MKNWFCLRIEDLIRGGGRGRGEWLFRFIRPSFEETDLFNVMSDTNTFPMFCRDDATPAASPCPTPTSPSRYAGDGVRTQTNKAN